MAIAKVQEVFSYSASGGSADKTVTIATPGAGNTLVLLTNSTNGATVSSVSGGGVTWEYVVTSTNAAGDKVELWIGPNSSGSGTTITVTVSNTYARFDLSVTEWSGMPTTSVEDGGSEADTTSPDITTPSITPTAGQAVLLLAFANVYTTTVSAGPTGGFTAIPTTGGSGFGDFAYQIVESASGSYQAGWTTAAGYGTRRAGLFAFDGEEAGGAAVGRGLTHSTKLSRLSLVG